MILFTDKSNPLGLKLLTVANFAKKELEIKFVTLNGKKFIILKKNQFYFFTVNFSDNSLKEPKHIPCLQLDDGSQFFMTDAAVKFLMSGIEEDTDIRSQVSYGCF